jgi:hypothetical protein
VSSSIRIPNLWIERNGGTAFDLCQDTVTVLHRDSEPTGAATGAGRPQAGSDGRAQSALCEGWPASGTLVRKTSRVRPRRCAPATEASSSRRAALSNSHGQFWQSVSNYLGLPNNYPLHSPILALGQEGPAGEAELVREASTGGVDHAQPAFRGGGWPEIGTPVSGQRRPVSVSFRPAERAWRGFLGPSERVSREAFQSQRIVSDAQSLCPRHRDSPSLWIFVLMPT